MYILTTNAENSNETITLGAFSNLDDLKAYALSYADSKLEGELYNDSHDIIDKVLTFVTVDEFIDFHIDEVEMNPPPLKNEKKTFTVHLEYTDADTYTVVAKNMEAAMAEAVRQWAEETGYQEDYIDATIEEGGE